MASENDHEPPTRRAIREQIDENLKRVYSAALNEELPDKFKELLSSLRAASTPSGDADR